MKSALHETVASGRWQRMTLAEQLGNIGSEYERARQWKARGKLSLFKSASERMLELFDLTLADRRWKNHRLKELARVREAVCSELYGDGAVGKGDLGRYFYYFAHAARSE